MPANSAAADKAGSKERGCLAGPNTNNNYFNSTLSSFTSINKGNGSKNVSA
jgi:hypothetical protein